MSETQEDVRRTDQWMSSPGPERDVVIATRAQLMRNFDQWLLPTVGERPVPKEVYNHFVTIADTNGLMADNMPDGALFEMSALPFNERFFLEENLQISKSVAIAGKRGQLYLTDGVGHTSVCVDCENHLNISRLETGWQPFAALEHAAKMEQEIEKRSSQPFAFDQQLGYLTARPSDCGTGLRVSAVVHLPGLSTTRKLRKAQRRAEANDLLMLETRIDGGAMWVVRNRIALGKTEEEIAVSVHAFMQELITMEREARQYAFVKYQLSLEDQVGRALALCSGGRLITVQEAISLLSALRLGLAVGMVKNLTHETLNELITKVQPAHTAMAAKLTLPPPHIDKPTGAVKVTPAIARQLQALDAWRAQFLKKVVSE